MSNITKEVYTVFDFCKMADITTSHTRTLLREGKIKGIKCGKEWRISRESALSYLHIETDLKVFEDRIKVNELEKQLALYESRFNTLKDMIRIIENLVQTN